MACRCSPGAAATSCSTPPASSGTASASVLGGPAGSWQVDAGDGLRAARVRRLRRGRGLRRASCRPRLELWGMPWTQRLLPDARDLFPESSPGSTGGGSRTARSSSRSTSTRSSRGGPCRARRPGRLVAARARQPAVRRGSNRSRRRRCSSCSGRGTAAGPPTHERGAARLAAQPRYRLHMNGTPDEAVDALEALLDGLDGSALRAMTRSGTAEPGEAAAAGAPTEASSMPRPASWRPGSRPRIEAIARPWRRGARASGRRLRARGRDARAGAASRADRAGVRARRRRPDRRRSTGSPEQDELNAPADRADARRAGRDPRGLRRRPGSR